MKETKNKGARKALLMVVACVLAVAVSVGVTLAYLTAATNEKVNTFQASSPDIKPVLYEPNYSSDTTWRYHSPGDTVTKDPLVQNESPDDSIYVGARVRFWLEFNNKTPTDSQFFEVDKTTFEKFVTFTGWLGTGWSETSIPSDTQSANANYDSKAKYLIYGSELQKLGSVPVASGTAYNTMTDDGDTTTPIFTAVKSNENIRVMATPTSPASTTATLCNVTTADGLVTFMTDHDDFTKAAGRYKYYVNYFNYRITIDGYAEKKTDTIDSVEDATSEIQSGLAAFAA